MTDVESDFPLSNNKSKEEDEKLLEPFIYLHKVKGKNIRRKLLVAFNEWLNIPMIKLEEIGNIIQMLHNASLLLDDIQDNSILRRGVPVSHKIFGEAMTINSANYVMFIALEKVIELGHPSAVRIYNEQLLELHRGQGMEIYWRDNFQCPSEEEYSTMTIRKTGGLFNLGVRLLQLFSDKKDDYIELTSLLGLYFQIRDDYANLVLKEYEANKSFAEDLTEGKFSFPIIHAINTNKKDNRVFNIVRQRTTDIELKKYCVSILESGGSFEYVKSVMEDLDKKIRAKVKLLGGNDILFELLDELKTW